MEVLPTSHAHKPTSPKSDTPGTPGRGVTGVEAGRRLGSRRTRGATYLMGRCSGLCTCILQGSRLSHHIEKLLKMGRYYNTTMRHYWGMLVK